MVGLKENVDDLKSRLLKAKSLAQEYFHVYFSLRLLIQTPFDDICNYSADFKQCCDLADKSKKLLRFSLLLDRLTVDENETTTLSNASTIRDLSNFILISVDFKFK